MCLPTKAAILTTFRGLILETYAWPHQDPAQLDRFMAGAADTLDGIPKIDRNGRCWRLALIQNGLTKRYQQTLDFLSELPAA